MFFGYIFCVFDFAYFRLRMSRNVTFREKAAKLLTLPSMSSRSCKGAFLPLRGILHHLCYSLFCIVLFCVHISVISLYLFQKAATHPAAYIVGWDNNNYLKDLTRRYVPHFNTVTLKQRVSQDWWGEATRPWIGPKSARDRNEDSQLDRMQLEAPLPKTVSE